MINPHNGREIAHTITLTKIDRRTAAIAAMGPIIYSEHFHRDGTVSVTGYFDDPARAKAWKAEYDPRKAEAPEAPHTGSEGAQEASDTLTATAGATPAD